MDGLAMVKLTLYGECGGIGRHTGLWFRRRGIASSSLVTYPMGFLCRKRGVYMRVWRYLFKNRQFTEEWPRGRWRHLGKVVKGNLPWVRIPLLPPFRGFVQRQYYGLQNRLWEFESLIPCHPTNETRKSLSLTSL